MRKNPAILLLSLVLSGLFASALIAETLAKPSADNANSAPVTLNEDESSFTLENGVVTASAFSNDPVILFR